MRVCSQATGKAGFEQRSRTIAGRLAGAELRSFSPQACSTIERNAAEVVFEIDRILSARQPEPVHLRGRRCLVSLRHAAPDAARPTVTVSKPTPVRVPGDLLPIDGSGYARGVDTPVRD